MVRINEETDMWNHAGSILLYTDRRRMERTAALNEELNRHGAAEEVYAGLLQQFPDQWCYEIPPRWHPQRRRRKMKRRRVCSRRRD